MSPNFVPVNLEDLSRGPALNYLVLLACNGGPVFERAGVPLMIGYSFYDVIRHNQLAPEQMDRIIEIAAEFHGLLVSTAGLEFKVTCPFTNQSEQKANKHEAMSLLLVRRQLASLRLVVPDTLLNQPG